MFRRIAILFTDKDLLKKILLVALLALCARFVMFIPLPFIKASDYSDLMNNQQGGLLQLLNSITGGGLGTVSIALLGITPYITASIVMQMLQVIVPSLQRLQDEGGNMAQLKINGYTRILTFVLAFIQSFVILINMINGGGTFAVKNPFAHIPNLEFFNFTNPATVFMTLGFAFILACGSLFLMWICEIISETKLINGASLLILITSLASIKKTLETQWVSFTANLDLISKNFKLDWNFLNDLFGKSEVYTPFRSFIVLVFMVVICLFAVIFVNEAIKKFPLLYINRGHSVGKSRLLNSVKANLPLRITGAGLMGIIIAASFLQAPVIMDNLAITSNSGVIRNITRDLRCFLSNDNLNNPNQGQANSSSELSSKCFGIQEESLNTYKENQQILGIEGKLPKTSFLNTFFSTNSEQLKNARDINITDGQELFAFSVSTFKGENAKQFKNQFTTGWTNPLNNKNEKIQTPEFELNPGGILPEFGIRFNGILAYFFFYFLLIVLFNYFFTMVIQNNPEKIAKDLERTGAYIPGVNPGLATSDYLSRTIPMVMLPGAIFIATVALVPYIIPSLFNDGNLTNTLGIVAGTQLFIIATTSLELTRNLDAETSIADYERYAEFS
jgi:preprotein translocase subunit SecY